MAAHLEPDIEPSQTILEHAKDKIRVQMTDANLHHRQSVRTARSNARNRTYDLRFRKRAKPVYIRLDKICLSRFYGLESPLISPNRQTSQLVVQ